MIQPTEYIGFPYAGWWKEREGKGRGIYPLRESTILLRISLSTHAQERKREGGILPFERA
jgi:hypothetical protein